MVKPQAPLGSGKARWTPRLERYEAQAIAMLTSWFESHPRAYVALSGGKDSAVCLHLAKRINPSVEAVFFDSGMEFPQTLRYVASLTQRWDVPLHVFDADPPLLDTLEVSGYWAHGVPKNDDVLDLYEAQIGTPLKAAQKVLGRASIYGLRQFESKGRAALLRSTRGLVTQRDWRGIVQQEYLAPIWQWDFTEVYAYVAQHGVPMNPLYEQQARLGIPLRRARVGSLINGWALEQGRWAVAHAVAPDLTRRVEARLPLLAELR